MLRTINYGLSVLLLISFLIGCSCKRPDQFTNEQINKEYAERFQQKAGSEPVTIIPPSVTNVPWMQYTPFLTIPSVVVPPGLNPPVNPS